MPRYDTYATPRADLGQALYEYMLDPADYIGIQALPVTPVPKRSATYSKIQRESLLRTRNVKRSSKAGYNRDTFDAEDDTYTCLEYGFESLLDDGDREHFSADFDAEEATAMNALHVILREQEVRIATALFNATTWTGATLYTDYSSTAPWTTTTSDVMTQILLAKEKVRNLTGLDPDTLIVNQRNFHYLKNNDDMVGRVVYSERADDATMAGALAGILGLKRILVGKAITNSAIEGQAFSASAVWSNLYAMLAVTTTPGSFTPTPCVGRTMMWSGYGGSNVIVEQYRDESRLSDVFRVRQYVAEEVIDASYAHLLKIAAS